MKTLIFDFGNVLVDWNPHHLFDGYFGDTAKADWFLEHICTDAWNTQMDGGKPLSQGIAECTALHPEFAKEIALYYARFDEMVSGEIEGMYDLLKELKEKGFRLLGLSNWSAETFYRTRDRYPIFKLIEGMVVSGDVHCVKPSPKIFRILFERFRLDPAECVFIDDRPGNIEGAAAVGLPGIRFTSAAALREEFRSRGWL